MKKNAHSHLAKVRNFYVPWPACFQGIQGGFFSRSVSGGPAGLGRYFTLTETESNALDHVIL